MIRKKRLCKCGCGEILFSVNHVYKRGHAPKPSAPHLCYCGCGEMANPGRRYLPQHAVRANQIKQAISRSVAKVWERPGYRRRISKAVSATLLGHDTPDRSREKNSLTHTKHAKRWFSLHPFMSAWRLHRLRAEVISRDKSCIVCGRMGWSVILITHHIVPISIGKDSRLCDAVSNLVTVCRSCHKTIEPMMIPNGWKSFLPVAYGYLKQFGYKHMLLRKYYHGQGQVIRARN
jgi:5-methylcytosine-specific restriction endonuclease McrA